MLKVKKIKPMFTALITTMDKYEHDMREIRANALLNHYVKELNIPLMFNQGFMDAMAVGEEIYQCDIVGGELLLKD